MKQEEIDRIVNALMMPQTPFGHRNFDTVDEHFIREALRTLPDPPQIKLKEVEMLVQQRASYIIGEYEEGFIEKEYHTVSKQRVIDDWRNRIGYTLSDLKQEGGEGNEN